MFTHGIESVQDGTVHVRVKLSREEFLGQLEHWKILHCVHRWGPSAMVLVRLQALLPVHVSCRTVVPDFVVLPLVKLYVQEVRVLCRSVRRPMVRRIYVAVKTSL